MVLHEVLVCRAVAEFVLVHGRAGDVVGDAYLCWGRGPTSRQIDGRLVVQCCGCTWMWERLRLRCTRAARASASVVGDGRCAVREWWRLHTRVVQWAGGSGVAMHGMRVRVRVGCCACEVVAAGVCGWLAHLDRREVVPDLSGRTLQQLTW